MLGRTNENGRDVSSGGSALGPNLVSLARPLLGWLLATVLAADGESYAALPIVVLACISDYVDGRMARRRGVESFPGRLVDNLCDAFFLGLALWSMGAARVWAPEGGWLHESAALHQLPLAAFAAAFSSYLARMLLERRRGGAAARSRIGHGAGIANYGLVVAGAVEAWPAIALPAVLVEVALLAVSFLNLAAVIENVRLMFPAGSASPTMPA
ncbi:MAG TPA: CDP-alcohol phosphatidyltransferase family protein [Candidatus Limnocylindrales bacterium]|nr:CDP-alcohol phosphatidyltransferase family protein [Candidatus Limnocylindrales bacterium]